MIPQTNKITSADILNFWFAEKNKPFWFMKDQNFDDLIKNDFLGIYQAAIDGKLKLWKETPAGILALILIYDQFSRNMFRGTIKSFATDTNALNLAKFAIECNMDKKLDTEEMRHFMYMPFMHSENLQDQEVSIKLFISNEYAKRHYEIIKRFGRFPHRNKILNRISTAEEVAFLLEPNSSF